MSSPVDFVNGDPNAGEAYVRGCSRCHVTRIKTHRFRSQALAFLRVIQPDISLQLLRLKSLDKVSEHVVSESQKTQEGDFIKHCDAIRSNSFHMSGQNPIICIKP